MATNAHRRNSADQQDNRSTMVSNTNHSMMGDHRAPVNQASLDSPMISPGPVKPKKGGFQITRVVTKSIGNQLLDDCDSVDDLDETNTEDVSSDILDLSTSKLTDIDQDPSSTDTIQSLGLEDLKEFKARAFTSASSTPVTTQNQVNSTPLITTNIQPVNPVDGRPDLVRPIEGQSTRFKVVKIESKEPFRRGRWMCLDFLDPPQKPIVEGAEKLTAEKGGAEDVGSGNSSTASSVHFVPGVDDLSNALSNIVYSESHKIVEPLPIRPSGAGQAILTNGVDYNTPVHNAEGAIIPIPNSNAVTTASSMLSQVSSGVSMSAESSSQYSSQTSSQGTAQPAGQQDFSSLSIPKPSNQEFSQPAANQSLPQPASALSDFKRAPTSSAQQSNNASPSNEILDADFISDQLRYVSGEDKQSLLSLGGSHKPLSQSGLTLQMVMQQPGNKDDDEGGASTVAIDNKIEQAMDLVKSHLMFAVREEVDILKEQIKDLLEKNTQLELENSLLRSSASPETLSKLSTTNTAAANAAAAAAAAVAANATQPTTTAS